MVLSKEQIQKTITNFFADKPVNRVWLFGSYARDEADEKSDIDVLVDMKKNTTIGLRYIMWKDELEKLLNKKFHVVSNEGVSKYIRPFIDTDKVLIYEK